VNYRDMCNEVLIRMREDEIENVGDKENEPQQKLVAKFVQDAYTFVQKSHTWNSSRRMWVIDLEPEVNVYTLSIPSGQAQIYSLRYASTERQLREVNQRDLARKKFSDGSPSCFSVSQMRDGNAAIQVWPYPDERYLSSAAGASAYGISEYGIAEYSGLPVSDLQIVAEGYKMAGVPSESEDIIELPSQAVLYYALALASRERGEVGGQSSQELFGLSRSYMSDAISWDVSNSRGEYLWEGI